MSLTNFNFLDREAALYKASKEKMEENAKFIQKSIDDNTKREKQAVEDAIKALNNKLDQIMEHEEIKKAQNNIEEADKQMTTSVDTAVKAYFNIKKKIVLYTDSNYLKLGITSWVYGWKRNNWINSKKEEVKNKSYWITLDQLNNLHNIEWKWVKAHSGNKYNERADKLATSAI